VGVESKDGNKTVSVNITAPLEGGLIIPWKKVNSINGTSKGTLSPCSFALCYGDCMKRVNWIANYPPPFQIVIAIRRALIRTQIRVERCFSPTFYACIFTF
jgi:hypothetical protein